VIEDGRESGGFIAVRLWRPAESNDRTWRSVMLTARLPLSVFPTVLLALLLLSCVHKDSTKPPAGDGTVIQPTTNVVSATTAENSILSISPGGA
jgi:hypothetical protein